MHGFEPHSSHYIIKICFDWLQLQDVSSLILVSMKYPTAVGVEPTRASDWCLKTALYFILGLVVNASLAQW